MNWQPTSIDKIEILQKCALSNNFVANNYSALNSILYEKKFNSEIVIEGDWIFERFYEDGKVRYSFPHNVNGTLQGDDTPVTNVITNFVNANSTQGEKLIFENITAEEKDTLVQLYPMAIVTPTPESGDYIYKTENLANLAGKKYSRKRNHIHQFQNKYAEYNFEPLSKNNFDAVRTIEENWLKENTENALAMGTLSDLEIEKKIIFFALENYDTFSKQCGMTGGVLYISGTPAAFCIASLLSQKVTDVHFEKCLSAFGRDGGYAIINNEFAKTVQSEFINREEDLGIEGLRKAKLSYYPEYVLEKFTVQI